MNDIPSIASERLICRPHRLDDFDAALAMWSDPAVTRYIGGKPSTPQQVWMRILNYAGLWALLGYGYWAVVEKSTNRFIGEAGFADFGRDVPPPMQHVPEAGWAFVSDVHGRGFGTEAVAALTAWGDGALASPRTVCLIGAENLASIRVAEKCGFIQCGRSRDADAPTPYFERTR